MTPDELAALIRGRRTSLLVDPDRAVPDSTVDELCELLTWAPNHKRTWPWELAWVTGDGRRRLGNAAADAMASRGDDATKVAKTRTKYLRSPGVVVVGSVTGDSQLRTAENRDAVASGVQNLLLGATAQGLGSFWSSCPKGADAAVGELCGFPDGTTIVAIIYLGWPSGTVEAPSRPPVQVRRVNT